MKPSRSTRILLVLLAATLLLLPFFAAAEPVTREFRKEVAPRPDALVVLENLAGTVTVEGKKEGPIEILATIHAGSADLLELLPIEVSENGSRIEVTAKYPLDRYDVYRYAGEGSRGWGSTSTTYLGRKVKIVPGGSSRGVELWADFVLRLPPRTGANLRNELGSIVARNVDGPVTARSGAGNVRIEGGDGPTTARSGSGNIVLKERKGSLEAGTGSGDISVSGVGGSVSVSTGSGNASLDGVTGSVDAHSGSGNVTIRRQEGERVRVRTGSGEILLDGARGSFEFDTGSGNIKGDTLTVSGALAVSTGSGDVTLSGDFAGLLDAQVGTASGDVVLKMAKAPGMSLNFRSSSGDIDVDVAGTKLRVERKLELAVAGGGVPVKVRTSSGSIRIAGK
ncbi:MAG TPA: DUF4097 family beta strand repeat-containing protein [Thermoanaerobaculia bacterium]|nr:DUF4097 family beta strand repeat-containing protein [Thermoanaerobaculia bacterium]